MKQTISVVISAFNEELTLGRCLKSAAFAEEIVVVDNDSSDKTVSIARKFTDKIYSRQNQLMLNINKNYGFDKATSDWILNLDADEEVPVALANEIQVVIKKNPKDDGFWIKRKNYSFGKWIQHGLWWPDRQIRLFRRGKGQFPCTHIHEYIKIDGQIGELTEPYLHYNYETIHQYLTKIDRASSSEAIFLKETKYQLAWYDAIRFPVSDFLKIFFAEGGYKDGLHGLVLSLFQSFYSFCVFAKAWEMNGFPQRDIQPEASIHEMERNGRDVRYWMLTTKIAEAKNYLSKLVATIERKLNRIHA
jgi:(heptosyl)LPS beta-1,4-glucosyltransferase